MATRQLVGSGRWIRLCVDVREDGTPIGAWSWEEHDDEGALMAVGTAFIDPGPFDTAADILQKAWRARATDKGWQLSLLP